MKNNKKTFSVLALILLTAVILSGCGGSSNSSSSSKAHAFNADLTIVAGHAKSTSTVSLICKQQGKGQVASATGVELASPADACSTAQKIISSLTNSSCPTNSGTATITGTANGNKVHAVIGFCGKEFNDVLPLLPAASVSSQHIALPNTSRNGLMFVSEAQGLVVNLGSSTSASISQQIVGKSVTVSCTTAKGNFKVTMVWPQGATQIVTHPTAKPKQCEFIVKGKIIAEAMP